MNTRTRPARRSLSTTLAMLALLVGWPAVAGCGSLFGDSAPEEEGKPEEQEVEGPEVPGKEPAEPPRGDAAGPTAGTGSKPADGAREQDSAHEAQARRLDELQKRLDAKPSHDDLSAAILGTARREDLAAVQKRLDDLMGPLSELSQRLEELADPAREEKMRGIAAESAIRALESSSLSADITKLAADVAELRKLGSDDSEGSQPDETATKPAADEAPSDTVIDPDTALSDEPAGEQDGEEKRPTQDGDAVPSPADAISEPTAGHERTDASDPAVDDGAAEGAADVTAAATPPGRLESLVIRWLPAIAIGLVLLAVAACAALFFSYRRWRELQQFRTKLDEVGSHIGDRIHEIGRNFEYGIANAPASGAPGPRASVASIDTWNVPA